MIDVMIQGKTGVNLMFTLPKPMRELEKLKERLGESGWKWSIRHIETECRRSAVNNVLRKNNQSNVPSAPDDIREINLLSYLLSRMDDDQLDNLNADIYGDGISTFELVRRAYYHADEYFSDGVTEDNRPVLYCDYECPYRGENVEELLRQENRLFQQRQKQQREIPSPTVMPGGM